MNSATKWINPNTLSMTGWPPGLLQNDSAELSRWLSQRGNAKQIVDEKVNDMAKQPEALRLADLLSANADSGFMTQCEEATEVATELRRLHEVNTELLEAAKNLLGEINECADDFSICSEISNGDHADVVRAAIAKATNQGTQDGS